jgi:hypothetical protein
MLRTLDSLPANEGDWAPTCNLGTSPAFESQSYGETRIMRRPRLLGLAILALPLLVPAVAGAQSGNPTTTNSAPPTSTSNYWTQERMNTAVPPQTGLPGGPKTPSSKPQPTSNPGFGGGTAPGSGSGQGEPIPPRQ